MASFDSKCIESPVMEKVLKVLDRTVKAFLEKPESKLGDLAALDEEELEDAVSLRPADGPVSSLGSVDIASVAEPVNVDGEKSKAMTANEEKLKDLLARILGIPGQDIQASDSFFELGGDSISAMRLVSEARALGLDMTVAQIFSSQSLSQLAALVGNAKERKLIELLSRILALEKDEISADDSFFELGGDSIAAMRLVAEARGQGFDITVSQIFAANSIAELAGMAKQSSQSIDEKAADLEVPFSTLGADAGLFGADRIQPLLADPTWESKTFTPRDRCRKLPSTQRFSFRDTHFATRSFHSTSASA